MRLRALFGCALFLAALSDARLASQNAPERVQEFRDLQPTWLEGTIGNADVRAFIERGGFPKERGLWGMYYYVRYWTPIPLDGDWTSTAGIRMYEGDPIGTGPRPQLDLQLTDRGAEGTWTSVDGRRLPDRLRRVAQPAPFDIASRRLRRFADPRWPIEISYPEGWFLQTTETELLLRSPDPQDMLFENELRCERGRDLAVTSTEADPILFQGGYFLTKDCWRQQSFVLESAIEIPKTRTAGSTTIMSGGQAYRAHQAWGYAGIAEATEHLTIDGSEWAHCVDRLLDSDDRIQPRR